MTWEIREIYESSQSHEGAWVNPEIYSQSFPQEHVIEGHCVKCIFARPKHVEYVRGADGVNAGRIEGILLVEAREMSGLRRGESLRVDGQVYRVTSLSEPVPGLWRAELLGGSE